MHLNDTGSWCVVWIALRKAGAPASKMAHAFFALRDTAVRFRDTVGGELYLKHPDGSLKRNG